MKKKSTLYVMTLFLLIALVFGAGSAAYAQSEAEDVELAVVDVAEVVEVDSEIMFSEIHSLTEEMNYKLSVDVQSLEWYLEDEVNGVSNLAGEDVTEEVDEVVGDKEDIEEVKDSSGVEDITDEIIDSLES
ncbi:MAG: hypothetical protein ACOCWP_03660 [Halanaerobium sp.]